MLGGCESMQSKHHTSPRESKRERTEDLVWHSEEWGIKNGDPQSELAVTAAEIVHRDFTAY